MLSAGKALALCRIGFGLYYISYAFDKTSKNWFGDPGQLSSYLFPLRHVDGFHPRTTMGTPWPWDSRPVGHPVLQ